MKELTFNMFNKILKNNPVIKLVMFSFSFIGAIGTVITIVLGWSQFYESFLSKEIYVPVWLIVIITFILVGAIAFSFRGHPFQATKEFDTIEGKTFGVQPVELDGKNFVNCKFDGSELVFRGRNGFNLQHNHFLTPPRISFQDYAGQTLAVMRALYKEPAFKLYIQRAFEQVEEPKDAGHS